MFLRVCAGSQEKPLYALQRSGAIVEDAQSGFVAAIYRIFLQLTCQRDYNLLHVTAHLAISIDQPFQGAGFAWRDQSFRATLAERDIKIMGRLARIEQETWMKVCRFGRALLQITNDNWYQTNDTSFAQTHSQLTHNQEIYNRLQQELELKSACQRFVERCPSRQYRVIVRLALSGCHANSGTTSEFFN